MVSTKNAAHSSNIRIMKPIIIVPYRNREEHLNLFLSHYYFIDNRIPICVVEQSGSELFNRGKLLNIGYLENHKYTHYIFHDVDMLPIQAHYLHTNHHWQVLQLASSDIQVFDYLGGVTRFTKTAFQSAGGYRNDYNHRAEDNEMRFNLKRLGINVINKFGKFETLEHERNGAEFDPFLWLKAQQKRAKQDQLSICQYKVIQTKEIDNVRHIIVDLNL